MKVKGCPWSSWLSLSSEAPGHQVVLGISKPASCDTGMTATARTWSQNIILKRNLWQVQKGLAEKAQHLENPSAGEGQEPRVISAILGEPHRPWARDP